MLISPVLVSRETIMPIGSRLMSMTRLSQKSILSGELSLPISVWCSQGYFVVLLICIFFDHVFYNIPSLEP